MNRGELDQPQLPQIRFKVQPDDGLVRNQGFWPKRVSGNVVIVAVKELAYRKPVIFNPQALLNCLALDKQPVPDYLLAL
jgi:hypothetical protein